MPASIRDLTGRIFGNQFRLEALLGRGGMGEVYLAEQLEIGRRVVIKLLNSEHSSNPDFEERFKREARVLAQLNHPHVVQLHTFGRSDDGIAYLAMEHVDGRTLTQLIAEQGALPEPQMLSILEQICSALVEAHARGIVHRDLKPDNVMITERYGQPAFVKVLDFGIAKLTRTQDLRLTHTGQILGTPQYMAPEQLREKPVDERTDLYALGMIGYELLTGHGPFKADNTADLVLQVLGEEPPPPSRKLRGTRVSQAAEQLILRCLAKEPARRFQTSSELHEALATIAQAQREAALNPPAASDAPASIPAADDDASQRRSERDVARKHDTRARELRTRTLLAWTLGPIALLSASVWYVHCLGSRSTHTDSASNEPAAMLPPSVWIQGMPFPPGIEYTHFTAQFIDARVPASPASVLAFYRYHLGQKWGRFQDLGAGLIFENPDSPIKTLSVTPADNGSRLFIQRKAPVLQPKGQQ